MLALILSYRHQIGLVEQNICRHEARVSKQTGIHIICVGRRLILKLGHTAQLAEHGVAVQHPSQLCMLGHMRLDEDDALLRV